MAHITNSVKGNAVTATVVFKDSADVATDPTESEGVAVTFRVLAQDQSTVLFTDQQALADKTDTGTFAYTFTPTTVQTIYIEAAADVQGSPQTARVRHVVKWAA